MTQFGMFPQIQPDGSIAYINRRGLGDIFSAISKGSGAVATGAGTAASLFTAGTGTAATIFGSAAAAQLVPVVGQIAGAVAVIAGLIAMQRSKLKAIKGQLSDVEQQRSELIRQSNELDQMILGAGESARQVLAQLQQIGIGVKSVNGLGRVQADPALDTITDEVYAKISKLQAIQSQLEQLSKHVARDPGKFGLAGLGSSAESDVDSALQRIEDKLSDLESMQSTFEDLAKVLTEGTKRPSFKEVALWGGGTIAVAYVLYRLLKQENSPKKTHVSGRPDRRHKSNKREKPRA